MTIKLTDLEFNRLQYNDRKETVTGIDASGKYLVKIQVVKNERKSHGIEDEFKIIRHLNKRGCRSCPTAYDFGNIERQWLTDRGLDLFTDSEKFNYIVEDYVQSEGNYSLADLLLSVIEQKKLGIYQGDIKPNNVRFNPVSGVCVLIDYDQAVVLSEQQMKLNNTEFFSFCDTYDREKYGVGNWLRHYPNVSSKNIDSFLHNGALNLSNTSLMRMQKTTNSASGIYHTIDTPDVFALGSRRLDRRAEVLDQVDFKQSERVLDVGCNSGLLCEYLYGRGCAVTGVDNDPHVVIAAKMIANISGHDIEYRCMDLDFADDIGDFDTIMLFSVFHHTRNTDANAEKLVKSCKRIIIETRLVESGKQPVNGQWVDTTRWSFQTVEDLITYLERTFKGFRFNRNLGFADKGRYILELVKQ